MNVVKQVVTKTNHYCGDCGHGVWYFDHENLDVAKDCRFVAVVRLPRTVPG